MNLIIEIRPYVLFRIQHSFVVYGKLCDRHNFCVNVITKSCNVFLEFYQTNVK